MNANASPAVTPSYQGLRILLTFMGVAVGLAALALLLATAWFYPLVTPLGLNVVTGTETIGFLLKGFGAVALGLSYLAIRTSRDPVRYIAVIDTLIIVLITVVLVQIYGLLALGADKAYPYHLFLLSTIIRATLALALIILRPRGVS